MIGGVEASVFEVKARGPAGAKTCPARTSNGRERKPIYLKAKKKKRHFCKLNNIHNNVRSSSQSHQRGGENADRTHPLGETAHFLFSGGA
jgi:hypothetical protein